MAEFPGLFFAGRRLHRSERPFLIAEIGLNHNGDQELAMQTIRAAAQSGADAVKFQSYDTHRFIDPENPDAAFLRDIFSRYQLTEQVHATLSKVAQDEGVIFFSTPLTPEWPDRLRHVGAPLLKIASGDLLNWQLLSKAADTGLPLLVSTGAHTAGDIASAAAYLKSRGVSAIFLHCVSLYPTPIEKINLGRMDAIRRITGNESGFSDHTSGSEAAFAAVIAGAVVIEKHFTLDRGADGPDHSISADPQMLREIRAAMDRAAELRGHSPDAHPEEYQSDTWGKRSVYLRDGGKIALRPRRPDLPSAADWSAWI